MKQEDSTQATLQLVRQLAEQALSRSAGAPLMPGNQVELLYDSADNFPAWEKAIADSQDSVFIEMYIFANDQFGWKIRDLLIQKAKTGIQVCLLYDWLGSWRAHLASFFQPLIQAGGQARAYHPPSLGGGLSLLGRNHRKMIIVDRRLLFVSGLCISSSWEGGPDMPPWRDTGLALQGPLLEPALAAFADSWAHCGEPLDGRWLTPADHQARGEAAARLIATTPSTARMMRLDLLVASFARRTLWLTDAYFMATSLYLSALKQAARDGVDVRLLVPRSSDIRWIAAVSRTQYRPLLEAGVRVYEWNGPMIHAKTAVADGRWARIGSTNLNLSSWLVNRELDIALEDDKLAGELEQRFLLDLENATEIVLRHARRKTVAEPMRRERRQRGTPKEMALSSAHSAARQAARIGDALGAVVRGGRSVESSEAPAFLSIGVALCLIAALVGYFPRLAAWPLALMLGMAGIGIALKSLGLYWRKMRKKQQSRLAAPSVEEDAPPPGKPK
ncbi:phosphatidylserine/phosphatidylglycerophosphate/cardiolipin synthase family protein [Chromobacterium sp. IIBBL 290-4]|uniref:phospholipase D-like domain-containing protein n=1 Tax=Chromobacterium sp. IIBBL 290-4 TaxID=2953890 RepID=UPI0020B77933|nr:cardiolipin synthase B [Chromobacterium sp. IIBBL 290-4]UTH76555.1 cardiolipin synthase B [Chromobacterium sp. IIBBL 290-4]